MLEYFRLHSKSGFILALLLSSGIAGISGCTYTPKQRFAPIKKNPASTCRNLKKVLNSKKEKQKIASTIDDDNYNWFDEGHITNVTLLADKAHTKSHSDFNRLYCPATLNDSEGHEIKGTFSIIYNSTKDTFAKNDNDTSSVVKWHTNRKDAERLSKEQLKSKLGKNGYKRYEARKHRMDCRSHHMKSVMRKNIPNIMDLKTGSATITHIKVLTSSRFKGPYKHYVIACNVSVYWSNGARDMGYSFDEWTNRYGQKKVSYTPPGVEGLPF